MNDLCRDDRWGPDRPAPDLEASLEPAGPPELTVVAPVYNESLNLRELHRRVGAALVAAGATRYEIIFVDDGSTDDSASVVRALRAEDPSVRLLGFSRNFGHQAAITAGLDFSRGRGVIVMDSDLQHPPELLGVLVALWREGFEVVYTVREDTADATLLKRVTSRWFYRLLRFLAQAPVPGSCADFRLLDRKAVDAFKSMRERTRFLRGLTTWVGFRSVAVPYKADRRFAGASSYSLRRMLRLATDGVTSFSTSPLYLSLYLGLLEATAGFVYGLYVLYARLFTDEAVPGWASVILLVTWSSGIQFVMIGVLGIYLGKVFEEVKQRPLYLLRETAGFAEAAEGPAEAAARTAAAASIERLAALQRAAFEPAGAVKVGGR